MRMLDLATQEVRKLQAIISELDKSMGWSNSHLVERSLDTNGVLPWHPAGATLKTATSPSGQVKLQMDSASFIGKRLDIITQSAATVEFMYQLVQPRFTGLESLPNITAFEGGCNCFPQAPSPKMSKVSRSIMEGHAGSFLERLQTDIENRQAKLKMARCTSSRHYKGAAHDQEVKDVKYIR